MNPELTKHDIEFLVDCLKNGKEIPSVYQYAIFPTKHKEYELVYAGKMRKEDVLADTEEAKPVPLQVEKIFDGEQHPVCAGDWRNLLVFGDNLQVLKTFNENKDPLIKGKIKGRVKLIYIDPPFGTGDAYDGGKGQSAYSAKRKGADFVEFIRRRVILLRELLADDGLIFVRMDYHFSHYVKLTLDEVFGKENFRNELIVNRIKKNVTLKGRRNIPAQTDTIFVYAKTEFGAYVDISKRLESSRDPYWHSMESAGFSGPRQAVIDGETYYPSSSQHFKFTQQQLDEMHENGRIRVNPNTGKPQYLVPLKEEDTLDSNWTDIPGYSFTTGYPTENSELLLSRVVSVATARDDLVMDVFAGSGTTLVAAEKLGRRWIGCDIGKLSIYTIQKRLLDIERSKNLEDRKSRYGKTARSFAVVTSGLYDLGKVFSLEKNDYVQFVKDLFEIEETTTRRIGGVVIDGKKREFYAKIFPYWQLGSATVDENYLQELHEHIGDKIDGRFYIIAPANCVSFISDYRQIGNVRYYFLKVPYQVIKELHKVQFKKFRQPQSKSQVNDLDDAIGFHFIRQPEVDSSVERLNNRVVLRIARFESAYSQDETGEKLGNFESLAMLLVDLDYDGEAFMMTKYFFAQDLLDHKSDDEETSEEEIKKELRNRKEIVNEFPAGECGKEIMVIYVDIYGNEFREILEVG